MTTFAAIDFETANRHPTSICSIGVVVVENAVITRRFHELVRPVPDYHSQWTTEIHGITWWDTRKARTFPDVWNSFAEHINGLPLVAHNSVFEESRINATLEHYGMENPGYVFHCTCRQARKILPTLPDHKLPTVANHFGIPLDSHHNALADAEACAKIALAIFS